MAQYNSLKDIPTLEGQAQLVGDFAELYLKHRDGLVLSKQEITALKNMARILYNSGLRSKAIRYVKKYVK